MIRRETLSFFIGSHTSFNVRLDVRNIGWMLADDYDLHLVTTDPDALSAETTQYFTVFSEGRAGRFAELDTLRRYLSTHRPAAVVQVISPSRHGVMLGPVCRLYGVPYVYRYPDDTFSTYRIHSGWRTPAYFVLHNLLGRVPVALADRYIVLGPRGRRRLLDRGVDPGDIATLPPPIDPGRFATPDGGTSATIDPSIPDDRTVILFVGRRIHTKGFDVLQAAIPDVLERRDDLHFVLIASGSAPVSIPADCRDHVTEIDRVAPDDIHAYFRRADLLVVPSRKEGLPRVILEALTVGTPVLASDVGEISSVTKNVFDSDAAFVDMLCDFESLSLDDASDYTRGALAPKYRAFFESVVGANASRPDVR